MEQRRFEGVIFAASGLHIAEPSDGTYRLNNQTKLIETRGADSVGGQITRTTREKVMTPGQKQPFSEFPVIHGNTQRGRLRRIAAKMVFDSLRARGQTISDYTFQGMMSGATYEGVDKETQTISRQIAAREHLFLGLWGGGPAMFPSGSRTNAASVLTPSAANRLRVHESYHEHMMPDIGGWAFMSPVECIRHDDFMDPRNGQWEDFAVVKDWEERRAKIEEMFSLNRSERKAQASEASDNGGKKDFSKDKVKKIDISNMIAIEIVNPGTTFFFRMELKDYLQDHHVGMAASCIAEMFNSRIGGWGRNGFGLMTPGLDYVDQTGRRTRFIKVDDTGRFAVDEKILGREMTALRASLEAVTAEGLDELYRNQSALADLRKAVRNQAKDDAKAAAGAGKKKKKAAKR